MKLLPAACQQCGARFEFPVEVAGRTVPCPHCGWDTQLPAAPREPKAGRPILFYLFAALIGAAIGAGVYFKLGPRQTETPPQPLPAVIHPKPAPEPDPWHGIKASAVKLEKSGDGNLIYAVGTLRNATARQRFGVKVEIDVFDSTGAKLDSATDYTQIIEPGKEWHFRALVVDRNASRALIHAVDEQK